MIADCVRRYSHSVTCRSAFAAFCAALLSSCADVRMPEYQRPESPANPSWSRPMAAAASASDTITRDWWREFRDPYLDTLVDRAIAGNFDLKVLAARIQVAAAQIGEAQAGALPTLELGAGAIFERSTGQKTFRRFDLGAQVNWEIDIWGKVEKGVQAQTAEYRASEADWRAGYLTLVCAVSTTYFQILQFNEQIDQQQKTLGKNREILVIYEAKFENGLVRQNPVLRQRAEINQLTNDLLELQRSRDLAENALATLSGAPAGELKVALRSSAGKSPASGGTRRSAFPAAFAKTRHCCSGVPGPRGVRLGRAGKACATAHCRFDGTSGDRQRFAIRFAEILHAQFLAQHQLSRYSIRASRLASRRPRRKPRSSNRTIGGWSWPLLRKWRTRS